MKKLSVRRNGRNAAETVDHNDSGRKVIDPRILRTRRLLQPCQPNQLDIRPDSTFAGQLWGAC
jgi:hypothetical protein